MILFLSIGDNKNIQFSWGNISGSGYKRCPYCCVDFSKDVCTEYNYLINEKQKELPFIIESLKNETNECFGIYDKPGFVIDLDKSLKELNLEYNRKRIDNLHNIKGFGERLYNFFSKEDGFDKGLEISNLKKYIYKEDHSKMNGYNWRLYYCLYDKTILPSINKNRQQAAVIIKMFLEIQQASYKSLNNNAIF